MVGEQQSEWSAAAPTDGVGGAGQSAAAAPVTSEDGACADDGGANDDDDGASVNDAAALTTDVRVAACGNGADAVTMPDPTHDGGMDATGSGTGSGTGSSGTMRKLKSALKTTAGGGSGGGGQVKSERFRNSGIRKSRSVRFNEALNTFLECDYVIYVDDDEYDLLYDLSACVPCAAAAAAAASAAGSSLKDPATLVNIRSFDLQLPETCVNYAAATGSSGALPAGIQCVAVMNPAGSGAGSAGDQLTLSPPDGYKDALYAAVMETIVDDSGRWRSFN